MLKLFFVILFLFSSAEPRSFDKSFNAHYPDEEKSYWEKEGREAIQKTLNAKLNTNVARNVILFLGDGMGIPTVTSSRIYVGQTSKNLARGEEHDLVFDRFPHVSLIKTYNVDYTVADSASTAIAYMSGVKTNKGVIGFDGRVKREQCETVTKDSLVQSIGKWSQEKGKRTGFVTTTRVTHATPAGLYAHVPERHWECDQNMPKNCSLKDIALQLVEDEPGRNFNVIMGGGFQMMDPNPEPTPDDPLQEYCVRSDGRHLWKEWLTHHKSAGLHANFSRTRTDLLAVDTQKVDYLMGIFANSHTPNNYKIRKNKLDVPSLEEMTTKAIEVLERKDSKGYFLLVEGGLIDPGHHHGEAKVALDETAEFNKAIGAALKMTDQNETLIVVTADHSHTMSINGYAKRGTPITGSAGDGKDDLPYTTLTYANGPGYNYTVKNGQAVRPDISHINTDDFEYKQQAAIPLKRETHGGEDVPLYAIGPKAHLFHSVHEQTYIAYAMAYASCVGKNLAPDCK